jgi:hypothetical protein
MIFGVCIIKQSLLYAYQFFFLRENTLINSNIEAF